MAREYGRRIIVGSNEARKALGGKPGQEPGCSYPESIVACVLLGPSSLA
jgi:hypothetical protein